MNVLVNLPAGFFECVELRDIFARLERIGGVRKRSHDEPGPFRSDLEWADAVLMWSWPTLTEDLLESAPRLRFRGHLDLNQEAARIALARSVPVSISRHGFSPAVSEMALGLILSTLRKISDYHSRMREGSERWVSRFPVEIDPVERELTGRSVGLVGLGRVGRRLAELLAPFHCPLRVFDPFIPDDAAASYHAQKCSLPELLAASEVVVLCAASNAGSRRLLGPEEIALLRPNAVLVNVARAALVDTPALLKRLQQGDLFAAIDVFDREPLEQDSELRRLPNAYLTPHRAGGVIASARRILEYLADDLEAVLEGRPPSHPLTEAMLSSLDG